MEEKVNISQELKVKHLLKERGILMKDFAQDIGVAAETLTRALGGNPQYSTLKTIADGLSLYVKDLFKEKQSEEIPVNGYIEFGDNIYAIKTIADFKELAEKIQNMDI